MDIKNTLAGALYDVDLAKMPALVIKLQLEYASASEEISSRLVGIVWPHGYKQQVLSDRF